MPGSRTAGIAHGSLAQFSERSRRVGDTAEAVPYRDESAVTLLKVTPQTVRRLNSYGAHAEFFDTRRRHRDGAGLNELLDPLRPATCSRERLRPQCATGVRDRGEGRAGSVPYGRSDP